MYIAAESSSGEGISLMRVMIAIVLLSIGLAEPSAAIDAESLAKHWAPIVFQDTADFDDNAKYDFITSWRFDDADPGNNWVNAETGLLRAYVYFSIVETTGHYYLGYFFYHPRDWGDLGKNAQAWGFEHQHDLEGVMFVIEKDGSLFGRLILTYTQAHDDTYYLLADPGLAIPDVTVEGCTHPGIVPGLPATEYSRDHRDHLLANSRCPLYLGESIEVLKHEHPVDASERVSVFIESEGHGVGQFRRALDAGGSRYSFANIPGETFDFHGDDGVVYYPSTTGSAGIPGAPNSYVPYALVPFDASGTDAATDGIWPYRSSIDESTGFFEEGRSVTTIRGIHFNEIGMTIRGNDYPLPSTIPGAGAHSPWTWPEHSFCGEAGNCSEVGTTLATVGDWLLDPPAFIASHSITGLGFDPESEEFLDNRYIFNDSELILDPVPDAHYLENHTITWSAVSNLIQAHLEVLLIDEWDSVSRLDLVPVADGSYTWTVDVPVGAYRIALSVGSTYNTDVRLRTGEVPFSVSDPAAPQCDVNPSSLAFDILAPGQSFTRTFTITNTNPIGRTISGEVTSSHSDYTITPSFYSLAGGEEQTFDVTYAPLALAAHAATISTGTYCGSITCSAVGTYIPAVSYGTRSGLWTKAGSPYLVTGVVTVHNPWGNGDPQWLYIEPGVTVMFMPETGIRVGNLSGTYQHLLGAISAIGTATEPIVFTAADGSSGGWTGLYTTAGSGFSVFEHCIIEKAVTNLNIGSPTCKHVVLRDASAVGVVGAVLDSCLVSNNGLWGGSGGSYRNTIVESNGAGGLTGPGFVDSCRISLNSGPGIAGGLNIHNSAIFDNSGPAFTHPGFADIAVSGNTVSGNGADWVEVASGFTITDRAFTWLCDGLPVHVPGDIQVGQSTVSVATFTIGAGTEVLFDSGFGIRVGKWGAFGRHAGGSLLIQGTEERPVRLGAFGGDSGDWTGIYIDFGSVDCSFEYCAIEEATTAISCVTSTPPLNHVVLARNSAIGLSTNSSVTMESCTVTDNGSHNLVVGGGSVLNKCLIANSASGVGVQVNGTGASITCCDVYGNFGGNYVGIIDPTGIDGNISANPEFCRMPGSTDDYALAESSPCASVDGECGTIGARDIGCTTVSSVTDKVVPTAFALLPCVPNPFNPMTTICFDLPRPQKVTLRIYDVAGRCVATLLEGRTLPAARHEVTWTGHDDSGRDLATGVYLYRLECPPHVFSRQMTLLR